MIPCSISVREKILLSLASLKSETRRNRGLQQGEPEPPSGASPPVSPSKALHSKGVTATVFDPRDLCAACNASPGTVAAGFSFSVRGRHIALALAHAP